MVAVVDIVAMHQAFVVFRGGVEAETYFSGHFNHPIDILTECVRFMSSIPVIDRLFLVLCSPLPYVRIIAPQLP